VLEPRGLNRSISKEVSVMRNLFSIEGKAALVTGGSVASS
jgi:hypothetical protein